MEYFIAFISVIIGSLALPLLKTYFNKSIESEFNRKLEEIKSELATFKEVNTYKFNKFHEKRFSVYESLYCNMNEMFITLIDFCVPYILIPEGKNLKEVKEKLFFAQNKSYTTFLLNFENSKIYLEEEMILQIEKFKELHQEIINPNMYIFLMESNNDTVTREDYTRVNQAYKKIESELKVLKTVIERKLREDLITTFN